MRRPSFLRRYFALMGAILLHALFLLCCTGAFAFVFLKMPEQRLTAYGAYALGMIFLFFPLYTALGGATSEMYRGNGFRPFSLARYGVKWAVATVAFLRTLVFFLPLVAGAAYAYTVVKAYDELTALIPLLCDVGAIIRSDGGLADGIYAVIGAFAFLLGLGLLGGFFTSSLRYAYRPGAGLSDTLAASRALLRRNRVKRLGVFLLNLLTWAPCLALVYYYGRDALQVFLIDWSLEAIDFSQMWPILPAWFVLAPLRPMITCSHLLKKEAS